MANRKFHFEYTTSNRIIRKTIRNQAHENRTFFADYDFEDRKSHFPITQVISKLLQTAFRYLEIEENGEVLLRNQKVNFRL